MKKINIVFFGRRIGFTLTELLVVVIILAILATLALPLFIKAIEKAKVGEAISNLNLIRTGEKIYFLEHGYFTNRITDLNIEDPNQQLSRDFYYDILDNSSGPQEFTARATRGKVGTTARPAPAPYQGNEYYIKKEGRIEGTFGTEPFYL